MKRAEQRLNLYYRNAANVEKSLQVQYGKTYQKLEQDLIRLFENNDTIKYSQKRLILMMRQLSPRLSQLNDNVTSEITNHLATTFDSSYLKSMFDIFQGFGVGYSFVKLDEKAIKTALTFPWSGDNFVDRLGDGNKRLIGTLRQELTQSMIQGRSLSKTTRAVSKQLGIGYKNTKRIVQTETAYVLSETNKAAFKETHLEEYEFMASLDNKTSEICRGLDGKKFPVAEMQAGVNASPMHPHCRSTEIPYFDDLTGERFARDLETGKGYYVPGDMTYEQWYDQYVK